MKIGDSQAQLKIDMIIILYNITLKGEIKKLPLKLIITVQYNMFVF